MSNDQPPRLIVPKAIDLLMHLGATLVVNISGGKDSQAMARVLVNEYKLRNWPGQIIAVHANLGRADWPETQIFSHTIAHTNGLELVVVSSGDLVDRMKKRMVKLQGTGKPFWPSKPNRYCTSDSKRSPIEKFLRQFKLVISAEGLRAEESPDRAKKDLVALREQLSSTTYQDLSLEDAILKRAHLINDNPNNEVKRLAVNWYPILDWKIEQVWNACGTSSGELEERRLIYNDGMREKALDGWICHPAYVRGMSRLSCAFCIFGSKHDLQVAKAHNPGLYEEYINMELASGSTFKNNLALLDI